MNENDLFKDWEPEAQPDRRIRLILDNQGSKHSVTLRKGVLLLIVLLLAGLAVYLGAFAFRGKRAGDSERVKKLETENKFLRDTVDKYSAELDSISARLDTLKIKPPAEEQDFPYFGGGGPSGKNHLQVNPGLGAKLSAVEQKLVRIKLSLGFNLAYAVVQLDLPKGFDKRGDGIPSIYPTFGVISDGWGNRIHPLTDELEFHTGLDIANKTGTPVYTTADGVVAKADAEPGFGKIVTISHTSGYRTLYGHLYSIKVKSGEAVHKGQIIALMGNTGLSTGPHLHYGVSRNGEALNPSPYLNRIDSRAGLGQ